VHYPRIHAIAASLWIKAPVIGLAFSQFIPSQILFQSSTSFLFSELDFEMGFILSKRWLLKLEAGVLMEIKIKTDFLTVQ
jgi:hypothetical protein